MHVTLKLILSQVENTILPSFNHSDKAVQVARVSIEQEHLKEASGNFKWALVNRESHKVTDKCVLYFQAIFSHVLEYTGMLCLQALIHFLIQLSKFWETILVDLSHLMLIHHLIEAPEDKLCILNVE